MKKLLSFLFYVTLFFPCIVTTMEVQNKTTFLLTDNIYDIGRSSLCRDILALSSVNKYFNNKQNWDKILTQKFECASKKEKYQIARKFKDVFTTGLMDDFSEKKPLFTRACRIIAAKLTFYNRTSKIEESLNFICQTINSKFQFVKDLQDKCNNANKAHQLTAFQDMIRPENVCLREVHDKDNDKSLLYRVYNIDNKFFESEENFLDIPLDSVFSTRYEEPLCSIDRAKKIIDKGFFLADKVLSYFLKKSILDQNLEDVEYFTEHGAVPDTTSFYVAVEKNNIFIIKYFIEQGFSVNKSLSRHESLPLCKAVQNGSLEIVKLLVENGANVNQKEFGYCSPLDYAVEYGYSDIADFLIKNGDEN